jgi:uncharacterized Zn-binding protein involved in type VI secretion
MHSFAGPRTQPWRASQSTKIFCSKVACPSSHLSLDSGGVSPLGLQAAARLGDPIAHSSAESGLITGMLLGAGLVLGAILVVGTGGAALPFLVGAVLTGAAVGGWIGEFAGSLSCFNENSGQIARGSPDVFINFRPAARTLADVGECSKHGPEPQQIAIGSESVFINYYPAARVKDKLQCSSFIAEGSPNVFVGGPQVKYTEKELDDEVRWEYRALLFGAGIAGALLLGVGVPAIVGGIAGGMVGGQVLGLVGSYSGEWLSENIGGEPEDWEKTGAFIGGAIGGWLGAKGGPKFVKGRTLNVSNSTRNEMPLTEAQAAEAKAFAKSLGMPEEGIIVSENMNTGYRNLFGMDILYIGTDVLPAAGKGVSPNARVSMRGALGHEIVGHRAADIAGKSQSIPYLEEAQASIRAARFTPELTKSERMTLARDGISRLHKEGVRLKDVKDQLWIDKP